MSERKGQETPDNRVSDIKPDKEGDEIVIEVDESEPLKGIIESDQAVEPDANIAEELKVSHKKEWSSETESNISVTAYAAAKIPLSESSIAKKKQQKKTMNKRRTKKEITTLTKISKQLDKRTTD